MFAGHSERTVCRRQGLVRQHGGIARLVGDRARVVAHAAVDRHISADAGDLLAAAHGVQGHAGGGHQGTAGFTKQTGQAEPPLLAGGGHGLGHGAHPLINGRRVIAGHITDPQTTADVQVRAGMA